MSWRTSNQIQTLVNAAGSSQNFGDQIQSPSARNPTPGSGRSPTRVFRGRSVSPRCSELGPPPRSPAASVKQESPAAGSSKSPPPGRTMPEDPPPPMGLPPEADEYIRESIQNSLGIPVSAKTLQLKLLASEDDRRRLQDRLSLLQGRLAEADRRLDQYRAEAGMSAQGLRRCVEEKEAMASGHAELKNHCAKLENECALYERDIERLMESCDDLARENEELKVQLKETSVSALISEVESLRADKEHLRINLHTAEEEVKVLFKENTILDKENKRLLQQLNREHLSQRSGGKNSAGASAKGKRKSSSTESVSMEKVIDCNNADLARQPLSPLEHNSPDTRLHKK